MENSRMADIYYKPTNSSNAFSRTPETSMTPPNRQQIEAGLIGISEEILYSCYNYQLVRVALPIVFKGILRHGCSKLEKETFHEYFVGQKPGKCIECNQDGDQRESGENRCKFDCDDVNFFDPSDLYRLVTTACKSLDKRKKGNAAGKMKVISILGKLSHCRNVTCHPRNAFGPMPKNLYEEFMANLKKVLPTAQVLFKNLEADEKELENALQTIDDSIMSISTRRIIWDNLHWNFEDNRSQNMDIQTKN